jgi:acyl-ACP--UDP-N-acetylglucosamine O-acyltransferase
LKIHPTAVVDPAASLAPDVEVGPYSVSAGKITVGEGTVIQSHVVLEGEVVLGRGNVIGHGSIIGGPPQDLGFKPETQSRVTIGDNNVVREHCTIHRGTTEGSSTVIGDGNFLMAGVHIGHNSRVANHVIIANNCLLGGYVEIDDRRSSGAGQSFTKTCTSVGSSWRRDAPASARISRHSFSRASGTSSSASTCSVCDAQGSLEQSGMKLNAPSSCSIAAG